MGANYPNSTGACPTCFTTAFNKHRQLLIISSMPVMLDFLFPFNVAEAIVLSLNAVRRLVRRLWPRHTWRGCDLWPVANGWWNDEGRFGLGLAHSLRPPTRWPFTHSAHLCIHFSALLFMCWSLSISRGWLLRLISSPLPHVLSQRSYDSPVLFDSAILHEVVCLVLHSKWVAWAQSYSFILFVMLLYHVEHRNIKLK